MNYGNLKINRSDEVLNLCGINERFDNESEFIQEIRYQYSIVMAILCKQRDKAGRSESGRNFNIAITELEKSCIRAIKGAYSI